MEDDQQFCLRWNNHQSTLISVFDTLLENGTLVDCTLAAEGKFLKAHKVVLSACSPYFATLLTQQYDKHPVFILKDVKFQELRAMMDYMYRGEVNISQDQLAALLRAAESLQIKGLSDNRGSGGGGGGGGNDSNNAKSSESAQKPIPVPVVSKPGLTIEQKRPNKHPAIDADICESREGSTSPTSRKRKKVRRRSTDANNLVDNHDQLSNSSSQSMPHHQQNKQQTSVAPLPQIASATSAANVLNVTKKTDIHEPKKEMDQSMHHHQQQEVSDEDEDEGSIEPPVRRTKQQQQQQHDADLAHMKDKMDSELLIEPKSEYDDGNDETVEDLTLDEEELLEDLDQAGPSHGGEGSSQGYAQWQVDRSQDEVFLAAQEAAGQHRDAQAAVSDDLGITRIAGLSWAQWNARLAMPLVAQLQETTSSPTIVFATPPTIASATTAISATTDSTSPINDSSINSFTTPLIITTTPTTPLAATTTATITTPNNINRESPERRRTRSSSASSSAMTPLSISISNSASAAPISPSIMDDGKSMNSSNGLGYPCSECGRYYKLKSSLRNHQKWECGKEPQFQCPFCSYKAKQKMHIGRHLERMHKEVLQCNNQVSAFMKDDLLTAMVGTSKMLTKSKSIAKTTSSSALPSVPSTLSISPIPTALNLTNINSSST